MESIEISEYLTSAVYASKGQGNFLVFKTADYQKVGLKTMPYQIIESILPSKDWATYNPEFILRYKSGRSHGWVLILDLMFIGELKLVRKIIWAEGKSS